MKLTISFRTFLSELNFYIDEGEKIYNESKPSVQFQELHHVVDDANQWLDDAKEFLDNSTEKDSFFNIDKFKIEYPHFQGGLISTKAAYVQQKKILDGIERAIIKLRYFADFVQCSDLLNPDVEIDYELISKFRLKEIRNFVVKKLNKLDHKYQHNIADILRFNGFNIEDSESLPKQILHMLQTEGHIKDLGYGSMFAAISTQGTIYADELEEKETPEEQLLNQIMIPMSQTIINTDGDGNIVNTGDHTVIHASIKIRKGDRNQLSSVLKNNGVEENDIKDLLEVIDTEEPVNESTFGEKVNSWMKMMLGKAVDGTWKIAVGAAGSLLAEVIKLYYGR